MTRLAGLVLLGLFAVPVNASNPNRVKKERPRPVQTVEPPLARPIPAPQPAPEPMVNAKVVMALACPQQAVAKLVVGRLRGYSDDPNERMARLLIESEDLRQARIQFQALWMNNQPRTLTYERLAGAVGP